MRTTGYARLRRQSGSAGGSVAFAAAAPLYAYLPAPSRYHKAMGSAQEVVATLETAAALGYLQARELPEAVDRFDHVVAMLFKLCR